MKKIPQNEFTERLNAIYDDLHLNNDDRFWADIVMSNFINMVSPEDLENIFVCEYGYDKFFNMMDLLGQSDDFIELLRRNDAFSLYEMITWLLSPKDGIKYDVLDNVHSIITGKIDPIMQRDIDLLCSVDKAIGENGMIELWYNYLKRIELYNEYIDVLNMKLEK